MGNFNFGKYKILTSATDIDATGKTLVISTHGALTGATFERPYPTVVQFCTPKMTSLRAALDEVIADRITASELASVSQKTVDDYSLTWFEGDPNDTSILATLTGTTKDVLVMKSPYSVTLSSVLQFLNGFGYKYPSILCVFCRVSAAQFQGATYVGGSTRGTTHQTVSQMNQHKVNATALALELQQKGFKK